MRHGEARSMQEQVVAELKLRTAELQRTHVRFLLGTDELIPRERRVAFSPSQLGQLRDDLGGLGITLDATVLAGAGARTDPEFADADYEAAGAVIAKADDTADLPPFDVVHCLKEPTAYEAQLRGPVLRIGALHLPTYPEGVCAMLGAKNFAAILDGAVIGNCSYRLTGGDRTPIVASMSRFAGAVSGRKVVEGARANGLEPGKVVVVGGGVAGKSAIREAAPMVARLVVIEPWEPMRRKLEVELPAMGFDAERFEIRETLGDALEGAIAVVFAHRTGARAAEKVCDEAQIRTMTSGGVVVDIAIDQGGSIRHDAYDESDPAHVARQKYVDLFRGDYFYYGEVNMPREEPHLASIHHGIASLPYVTYLLAEVARHGSAEGVASSLLRLRPKTYGQDEPFDLGLLDAVEQDLRNGIPLAVVDGEVKITDADVDADTVLRDWVERCVG